MKVHRYFLSVIMVFSINFSMVMANNHIFLSDSTAEEGISKKMAKKHARKVWRQELNAANLRFFIKTNIVSASLDTRISFELLGKFLTASIGLEDDLGLPDRRNFITGSFLGRITPNSGIYAQYYGLSRSVDHTSKRDVIFLDDTIPAGTISGAYFNTQVFSAGYLLSLMKNPDSFFGIYLNFLVMNLKTGIYTDYKSIDSKLEGVLPFPSFGLVASFKLNNWILFSGNVGFFAFRIQTLDESLYDFSLGLQFRVKSWLGLTLNYQEFDIQVIFPRESVDVRVDYNFRGPSFGVVFSF